MAVVVKCCHRTSCNGIATHFFNQGPNTVYHDHPRLGNCRPKNNHSKNDRSPNSRPCFDNPDDKIKPIAVDFNGGKLTSDSGAALLQRVDQKIRLIESYDELPEQILIDVDTTDDSIHGHRPSAQHHTLHGSRH